MDRLPSGRWRVRYYADADSTRRLTRTFATRTEASDYLATVRTDQLRGEWRDPRSGAVPVAEYAAGYLATRHDLRPSTRALYADLLARWIDADLPFTPPGGRARVLNVGRQHLRSLTVADVREWHAAVLSFAHARAELRAEQKRSAAEQRRTGSARGWARAHGYTVAETGRLPRAVLDAWRVAGCPTLDAETTAATGDHSAPARAAGPVGATQARLAYSLLRLVLGAAVRDGLITANPCQVPRAGQSRPAEKRIATPEQVAALAEQMPVHLAAAVHLAAWSGLRGGELFALARRHLDLEAGTVRVERTLVEITGQPITFGPPKTDASLRTVYLPASVVDRLRGHLAAHVGPGPDALLFTTTQGRIVSTPRRSALFAKARAQVGCGHITWHSLRHTAATLYARTGATTKELQARLGHSTVHAAMIYQHASAERDRHLTSLLDRLAAPAPDPGPADPGPADPGPADPAPGAPGAPAAPVAVANVTYLPTRLA